MSIVILWLALHQGVDPAARQAFEEGRRAYNVSDWPTSISRFTEFYRATGLAIGLYNLGQSKRQAGDVRGAVEAYKAYLREKPDASNRAAVETRIRELESARPGAASESSAVSDIEDPFEHGAYAQPPKTAPRPVPPRIVGVVDPLPGVDLSSPPAPTRPRARRAAPLVAAGATAVLVASAVASGLMADARYRELRDACGGTARGCARSDVDGLRARATVTSVLWGLAAGSAVTTGVLFYVDRGTVGVGGRF